MNNNVEIKKGFTLEMREHRWPVNEGSRDYVLFEAEEARVELLEQLTK